MVLCRHVGRAGSALKHATHPGNENKFSSRLSTSKANEYIVLQIPN